MRGEVEILERWWGLSKGEVKHGGAIVSGPWMVVITIVGFYVVFGNAVETAFPKNFNFFS